MEHSQAYAVPSADDNDDGGRVRSLKIDDAITERELLKCLPNVCQ